MSESDPIQFSAASSEEAVRSIISRAISFGSGLLIQTSAENVLLGITQAGMTGTVRSRLSEVITALQTGSLYDAITLAKALPAESKDSTFITDARLLSFVNRIETYLGITLSTSL